MYNNELVSVIIPTYKRPDVLSRSINSVLNQTYNNIEIIVVDDNDPKSHFRAETEKEMQVYKDNCKVKYIKHEKNKNGSAARNTGFRASKGKYIMFLDDDDEFYPIKIEAQVACLNEKDNDWGACYTEYIRVDEKGKTIATCGENREGKLIKDVLARNLFIHAGSNLMVRRSVVEEINGFDESFKRNQDIEFLARILLKYKLAYVNKVGLIVHAHGTSKGKEIDVKQVTEHYLDSFSPFIGTLPQCDQKYISEMIHLQLFRYYLLTKKNIKSAYIEIAENNISYNKVLRYVLYLLRRKISKKAYGFIG